MTYWGLHQHIHAGSWHGGTWVSHPYTFGSKRGFELWARRRERRGAVVQWRFCGEADAQPWPAAARQVRRFAA